MTDKTPAMPELPEPELGHIETDKSRQPAFSARQMREALQSAQPAAAGVSDVIAMVRERYRGTKWGKAAECICDAVDEAILALRPQAEPAQPRTFDDRNAKFREENWQIRFDAAVEARRAAQERLYTERERHTAEVKRLQAEIGRLQSLRPQAV